MRGWTAGLNLLGAGPYQTVGLADLQATLKLAARAMLETGRPVVSSSGADGTPG